MTNEEVYKVVSRITGYRYPVWLGGRKELGQWNWSDNSTWGFNNWGYSREVGRVDGCLESFDGRWYDVSCGGEKSFICQLEATLMRGVEQTVKYKEEMLGFSSFHVWYEYKAASQKLLDIWADKRMTGFQLSWRIEHPTLHYTLNTTF